MKHIVSLSGGTASAVAADRILKRYGPENTTLWFADTSWEDEDLYRFLEDLGRCVKQGIKEWQRLKQTHPKRFKEVADWEQAQRAQGGPRANFSIMKDRARGSARALPLYELGERKGEQLRLGTSNEDVIGCFCSY